MNIFIKTFNAFNANLFYDSGIEGLYPFPFDLILLKDNKINNAEFYYVADTSVATIPNYHIPSRGYNKYRAEKCKGYNYYIPHTIYIYMKGIDKPLLEIPIKINDKYNCWATYESINNFGYSHNALDSAKILQENDITKADMFNYNIDKLYENSKIANAILMSINTYAKNILDIFNAEWQKVIHSNNRDSITINMKTIYDECNKICQLDVDKFVEEIKC